MENIKNEVTQFLEKMTFPSVVMAVDTAEDGISILVTSPDGRFLIGSRGEVISCLDMLVKKIILKKYPNAPKFLLDINEYRQRKFESLKEDAKNFAKQVRLYRKEIALTPMPSFERRVIHSALSEYPDIVTESVGVEPNRRIVIKPYQ